MSAIIGLLLAIVFNTTPGPAMCVVATFFYFLAVFFSPSKGLLFKYLRKRSQSAQIEREDIIKYLSKERHRLASNAKSISSALGIASSKITSRMRLLVEEGYVLKQADQFALTAKGSNEAQKLVRAHRLWETFLVNQVGLEDNEIHEDAEKYEHLLDKDILDQLDAKLGYPTMDPHGSPIPIRRKEPKRPLIRLKPRSRAMISNDQIDDEVESKLWELGLLPATKFQVVKMKKEEVTIQSGSKQVEIPAELAAVINVD